MRKIRALSIVIFIVAAGIYLYVKVFGASEADTEGPEIHMSEESIEVSASAGKDELLAGVTAEDARDGDVSDSLVIESMTNFLQRGRRTMTLAACDSDNNVTKATREIIYNDYTPPSFSLSAPLYFPINTASLTGSLTVSDILDGDLTSNITIYTENEVRVDIAGEYPVVFSVANSAGDTTQLPATVTIYDPAEQQTLPYVSLTQYLIHIQPGDSVDPWQYIDEVSYRGSIYKPEKNKAGKWVLAEEIDPELMEDSEASGDGEDLTASGEEGKYLTDVEITNPVDVHTPGTYEVTYSVSAGEQDAQYTGTMRLIVVVDEQGGEADE